MSQCFFRILQPHFAYTQQITQSSILNILQCVPNVRVPSSKCLYRTCVLCNSSVYWAFHSKQSRYIQFTLNSARHSTQQQQSKQKLNTIFIFYSLILDVVAGTCVHQMVCKFACRTNGKVVNMYGVWYDREPVCVCVCVKNVSFRDKLMEYFAAAWCLHSVLTVAFSQSVSIFSSFFTLTLILASSNTMFHLLCPLPIAYCLYYGHSPSLLNTISNWK